MHVFVSFWMVMAKMHADRQCQCVLWNRNYCRLCVDCRMLYTSPVWSTQEFSLSQRPVKSAGLFPWFYFISPLVLLFRLSGSLVTLPTIFFIHLQIHTHITTMCRLNVEKGKNNKNRRPFISSRRKASWSKVKQRKAEEKNSPSLNEGRFSFRRHSMCGVCVLLLMADSGNGEGWYWTHIVYTDVCVFLFSFTARRKKRRKMRSECKKHRKMQSIFGKRPLLPSLLSRTFYVASVCNLTPFDVSLHIMCVRNGTTKSEAGIAITSNHSNMVRFR